MKITSPNIKPSGASPAPKEMTRRFILGFVVSALGMVIAALIYIFFSKQLVFDATAQILMGAFTLVGVLVGWWMIKTGEKYIGYGVLFGSIFGVILVILATFLIALMFVAQPATGA